MSEKLPEIIYVRGGDKLAALLCRKTGMKYGTRHDYKPYAPVYMLDIKWSKYDWNDYLRKVSLYNPILAMVPDLESHSQISLMNKQIDDLKKLNVPQIMVCPKYDGAIFEIPRECIVAVSVPTGYAGFLPKVEHVLERKLHLLGGHPDQQLYLMQLYSDAGGDVVSTDGNVIGLKAMLGQYWARTGGWKDSRKDKIKTIDLAINSTYNIRSYFLSNQKVFRTARVSKCMYANILI